jgi:hypothetical protein
MLYRFFNKVVPILLYHPSQCCNPSCFTLWAAALYNMHIFQLGCQLVSATWNLRAEEALQWNYWFLPVDNARRAAGDGVITCPARMLKTPATPEDVFQQLLRAGGVAV